MNREIIYCDHLDRDSDMSGYYDFEVDLGDSRVLVMCRQCGKHLEANVLNGIFQRAVRDFMQASIRGAQ